MSEENQKNQVIELRKKGLSYMQIRKQLGIRRSQICKICREAGLSNREVLKNLLIFEKEIKEKLAEIDEKLKIIEERLKK